MSLRYIIDGCNITHHPGFRKNLPKLSQDSRAALIEFIRAKRLCGSRNNSAWVVFDGHADHSLDDAGGGNINIIFSRHQSADERIKNILESSGDPKNTVVVSDDKEVIFFARSCRARTMAVGEFIAGKISLQDAGRIIEDPGIGFSAMQRINEELRRLWLK